MSETQNIEYKSTWHDEYLKWICGFANSSGGTLFIGKDNQGNTLGIPNALRLMEEIPNKVRDLMGIAISVNLHELDGNKFLELIIHQSMLAVSYRGKYYIRSGNTNSELTGPALTNFLMKKSGKTWEEITSDEYTLDELDPDSIHFFKSNAVSNGRMISSERETDIGMILQNLNLIKNGKLRRAAVLLFGKAPVKYFPSCIVKLGRFGISETDLVTQDVIEGNILQIPNKVIEVLKTKYFNRNISYEGIYRHENLPYPEGALREILINSVIHKDYSGPYVQIRIYDDKITFWNPGKLPPELTFDDLIRVHPSYPPNPIMANVFFRCGLIEAWGRGTIKITEDCLNSGLPTPEFGETGGGFYVTLFQDRFVENLVSKLDLSERQKEVILYLKKNGKITNQQYQEVFKVSRSTALRDLEALVESNFMTRSGKGRGTVYSLILTRNKI